MGLVPIFATVYWAAVRGVVVQQFGGVMAVNEGLWLHEGGYLTYCLFPGFVLGEVVFVGIRRPDGGFLLLLRECMWVWCAVNGVEVAFCGSFPLGVPCSCPCWCDGLSLGLEEGRC